MTMTAKLERIVQELKAAGFSNNDVSILLPDKLGTKVLLTKYIFERAGAHGVSYSEEKGVPKQEESGV